MPRYDGCLPFSLNTIFTWKPDKLWLFRLAHFLVFSWEINKVSLSLQGKPEMVFVANDKIQAFGLPWWRSGWESACRCRGHGFEPWSGRIPHATEQLGPWATITEPVRLEPVLRNQRGRDGERPTHRDEEWPPLATTGESPRTEMKTQHSHK